MPWAEITHLAHYPMLRASPPPPHILGVYDMWAPHCQLYLPYRHLCEAQTYSR